MFKKRHPAVGARPGTLVARDDAPPTRIHMIRYTAQEVVETDVDDPQDLAAALSGDGVTWVDVRGLGSADVIQAIGASFSLHALVLEDVVNTPQRPKVEAYDDYIMYISRMVSLDDRKQVAIEQVAIIFGRQYILTFQETYHDVLDPVRERLREGLGPMRSSGPDYLAYAIIDNIIDYYYPAVDIFTDDLEKLEAQVIAKPSSQTLVRINRIKHQLLDLRRGIWPQRDAVNTLIRDPSEFVSKDVRTYLRDCYDHCVQIADIVDTQRDIASGLFNTYLSVVSNRMNEVMKVLTIMASIFVPLTFMAGIYGMNFDKMPELNWPWAYPLLLLAMLLVAGGMICFFYRRGWLSRSDKSDE